jgi:hypothetical protein
MGELKKGTLSPQPGYGWAETVTGQTAVYNKDEGSKIIIIIDNPATVDVKSEESLGKFYTALKKKMKTVEEYGSGAEKLNGKDSYYFDFSFETEDAYQCITVNIVNIGKKQYIIQRISPIVDTKVDEEMLTILKTWK